MRFACYRHQVTVRQYGSRRFAAPYFGIHESMPDVLRRNCLRFAAERSVPVGGLVRRSHYLVDLLHVVYFFQTVDNLHYVIPVVHAQFYDAVEYPFV